MKIDGAFRDIGPLLAEKFDLLGFSGGGSRILGDKQADALAEALDMLPLLHQHGERAFESPAVRSLGSREAHHRSALRLHMVRADTFVGDRALAHHVGEGVDVAAGLPDGRMHDDRGIEADDIVAVAGHRAPPGVAEVALQFRAERAVIPEATDAAVDLGGLEDEAAPLAEADDLLHAGIGGRWFGHTKEVFRLKAVRLLGEKRMGTGS